MIEIRLGTRYAKSILGLAKERGELEEIRKDFQLIDQVCDNNPDFVKMLQSPLISSDKKDAIIKSIFKGKLSELTFNFIEIVTRKRREQYLKDVADRFLHLYDLEKNITRGHLISAYELDPVQKKAIIENATKAMSTTFELTESIDPTLIGGFVLKIGDLLYDGSLTAGLRQLKKEFEGNPYIKA